MVYENESRSVYCETGWILSSDSNSNNSPYQARYIATPTTERVKKCQLGIFDAGKLNILLTLIPILDLFLRILITGGHEVGAIDYL